MSGIDPTTLTPRVAPSGEPAPIGRPTSLGRGSPSGVSRRGAVIGPLLRSGRATPVAVTAARPPPPAMGGGEAAGGPAGVGAGGEGGGGGGGGGGGRSPAAVDDSIDGLTGAQHAAPLFFWVHIPPP